MVNKGTEDDGSGALALTLGNVGGVFLVLVVGCFAAVFVTSFEMVWEVWMVSREAKVISKVIEDFSRTLFIPCVLLELDFIIPLQIFEYLSLCNYTIFKRYFQKIKRDENASLRYKLCDA